MDETRDDGEVVDDDGLEGAEGGGGGGEGGEVNVNVNAANPDGFEQIEQQIAAKKFTVRSHTGSAKCWKLFEDVVNDVGQRLDVVRCKDCAYKKQHKQGGSTTWLNAHVGKCKGPAVAPQPVVAATRVAQPVTRDMKDLVTDRVADCFAGHLIPYIKVDGKYFIRMFQCGIDFGNKYGPLKAEDVLPHSTTVARR